MSELHTPGDSESLAVLARIAQPTRKGMSRSEILEEADACADCDSSGMRTWDGHWYIKHEYRCDGCKARIRRLAR